MQNEIYFGRDLISDEVLQHYGMPRRSGRYPWGSGEDPYHHGASAPGGKKSSSIKERLKRRAAVRESVKKAKAEAIEREEKEERERKKEAAIKSGDPRQLAPFIRDLSDDELKEATNRLRLENDFMNKLSEASRFNKSTADKVEAKVKKLNSYTSTGIDVWNNYAKIANAFRDEEDQLPILGSKKGKNKDKKDSKSKQDKGKSEGKHDKEKSEGKQGKDNKVKTHSEEELQDLSEQIEERRTEEAKKGDSFVERVDRPSEDVRRMQGVWRKLGETEYKMYRDGNIEDAPAMINFAKEQGYYKRSGTSEFEPYYLYSDEDVKLAKRKKVPKLKR